MVKTKQVHKFGEGLQRALAKARNVAISKNPYDYPIKLPDILPCVVPHGATAPVLAMDFSPYQFLSNQYVVGGFPGFSYLSQLSMRAEYRAFASNLSTEVTREWIEFTSKQTDGNDSTDKIKAIEEEFKRLDVRSVFQRAVEHDCYFGRAQIFIDIENADRKSPLILDKRTIKQGSLKRICTVEAIWTTPSNYDSLDPVAPSFYKPVEWFMLGQQVHASRLMTVITRPLPDILKPAFNFAGISLSQLAEPYVDNWLRTRQSVADLINNFSITALATSMDQVLQGDDDGASILARADLFTLTRANRGLMLLDKEREEIVQVNTPLSGLHELQAQAQEHMCLSKGTLIETKRGQIPIEEVSAGDEVMTRNGYAPVEWSGVTGVTSSFIEIETHNSVLRLTEDHPVWSETIKDFVSAKNVSLSHCLKRSQEWESMDNQSHGEGAYGVVPNTDTLGTQKQEACFIESSMKPISEKSQQDLMSITKTKTQQTIELKTSFCFPGQSTLRSTSQKDGDSNCAESSEKNAFYVGKNILHLGQNEQNSVLENAKQKITKSRIQVDEICRIDLDFEEPVYNIKVLEGFLPEFFANGILVHNCSVSRMPAVVLTGISPSGLNASSDGEIRVFYDWIAAQQEAFWRSPLETILQVVQLSLFGEIDPDIGFSFIPLYQMSPKELAEIRESDSRSATAYVGIGAISPEEVRENLAKDPESGYLGIDAELSIEPIVEAADKVLDSEFKKQEKGFYKK